MECFLCKVWNAMPYAKRWSTPITPQQGEEALVVGFWAGLHRGREVMHFLCEKHNKLLEALNKDIEKRTSPTIPAPASTQPIQPVWGSGTVTPFPPVPNSEPPKGLSFGGLELNPNQNSNQSSGGIVCPVCRRITKPGEVHKCSPPEDSQPTIHDVLHEGTPTVDRYAIHSGIDPLPGEPGYHEPGPPK